MTKVYIGSIASWEINENGQITWKYLGDNKKLVLSNSQKVIIDEIIKNTLWNDNFISASEIGRALTGNVTDRFDRYRINKILNRLRSEVVDWGKTIESSKRGYRIKISIVSIDSTNEEKTGTNGTEQSLNRENDSVDIYDAQSDDAQHSSPVLTNDRTTEYINNFIRDKGITHTYYYSTTPHPITDVYCPSSLINREDDSISQIQVKHEKGEHNRYIISGPIGSGKSILARALANEVSKSFLKINTIPIIFDLSSFSDTTESLFELLKKEYEAYIPNDEPNFVQSAISMIAPSDFATYCRRGKCLFIFDSLDRLNPDLNSQFMQKLKMFLRAYGDNTIVILTRPTSNFIEYESFTVLNMVELSEKQASVFVDKLLSPYDTNVKKEFKNDLMRKYDTLFGTPYLYSNPLFLSILAKKLRKHRFYFAPKLYESIESFIKYAACEDRVNIQHRHLKTRLSFSRLNNDLSSFCYYLVVHSIEVFDVDVFDSFKRDFSLKVHYTSEDFLDDLCRAYGLTQFSDGKYEFVDSMLVEYFYVKYILSYDNELTSVMYTMRNNEYSIDNVLDMLSETNRESLDRNLYCPMIDELLDLKIIDKEYEQFLIKYYPYLQYYVGLDDHPTSNIRVDTLYRHMVKDWGIQQDINHLKLPPIATYSSTVYKLNKDEAQRLNEEAGILVVPYGTMLEQKLCNKQPEGYIYEINVLEVLKGREKNSQSIRDAIMSENFPLRIEFIGAVQYNAGVRVQDCDFD